MKTEKGVWYWPQISYEVRCRWYLDGTVRLEIELLREMGSRRTGKGYLELRAYLLLNYSTGTARTATMGTR